MDFNTNLKREINFKDIEIKDLAKQLNISYTTLLSYVNKKNCLPNVLTAYQLATALNTTVEALVTGQRKHKTQENNIIMNEYLALPDNVAGVIKKLIHVLYLHSILC
jgi:hypothetical protein